MYDQRVHALLYKVSHGDGVDYARARPLETETEDFSVILKDLVAKIILKRDHASVKEARTLVDPFLEEWEFAADLALGPYALRFQYHRAQVEYFGRTPPLGPGIRVIGLGGTGRVVYEGFPEVKPRVIHGLYAYPSPPSTRMSFPTEAIIMRDRYMKQRQGREPLTSMAYYCLTVLEQMGGGRKKAAHQFGIGLRVLNRIGALCHEKGGEEARKSKGADTPFTPAESKFLRQVIPDIILRVAQVAADPDQVEPKLVLTRYFPLSKSAR